MLKQLELERWTPREREDLINELRNEIDLLWLTGEIRLEKPTVEQEVTWGLHFFDESLFDGVMELYAELDRALEQAYPALRIQCALQFFDSVHGLVVTEMATLWLPIKLLLQRLMQMPRPV